MPTKVTQLSDDLNVFVGLLNSEQADFLIVGAHALAFHAVPRYTGDLDIWVRPTEDNARSVLQALGRFGFANLGVTQEDLTGPQSVIQLGYPPNRIDLLTGISGVRFDTAWQNKVSATLGDHAVFMLGRDDLIENKRASGRPKDLADLAALDAG